MTSALPTVGAPIEGCDGYVLSEHLPDRAIRRRWLYRGTARSVEWACGGVVKLWDGFDAHDTPEKMTALLEECRGRGVDRPSSYADIFHKSVSIPPVRRSVAKCFPQAPGAWQTLRDPDSLWARVRPFDVRRPLYQYDIRSAYLWSMSQGLPDPATFRSVRRVTGPGLYWCPSPNHPMLPFPWNSPGCYPATEDEIATLPLPWREVERGVRYDPDGFDVTPYVQAIRSFSCWKQVARSFWGRWGASGKLVAQSLKGDAVVNEWETRDPRKNPVWASIITSRVRMRLWRTVDSPDRRVYRCYVDSVVTDEPIEESAEVGGWALKMHFPDGGRVTVPGVVELPKAV